MSDVIVIDGDMASFQPGFGAATVVVRPGPITASGKVRVTGKPACVAGDEGSVSVAGCMYTAGPYSIPGTGTLSIASLAGDQQAKTSQTGSKKLLLKGGSFTARFTVSVPAMQPPPGPGSPIPDPTPTYSGSGNFIATDATVKAG
ncbi:hypothetical protein SSBR45G_12040 [Bradyrhizobium sp. SSBR45G]|uniref:hypothetical protein n=1 Tax=unclassified Bradyrhizobium TaxID=2631580 RepID=UPI002342A8D2|nr:MULTISPECIES: hypothetical protein [unclassified Bradyrhizobium]GLH76296.1 hypothetical protein SSBR45G_12040 [Bradyrhizobium sp. SSBR45G]GLH83221.1 hypothetical protein SSBR45R_06810 [Bradyrhizobium sp. SSBR45R]